MFRDFTLELVAGPGTSATVILNSTGNVDQRVSLASRLVSGTRCFYYLTAGLLFEYGIGTFTAGSPPTLTRDTVLDNSSHTTGRLNFAASTYVHTSLPAEYAIYRDAGNNVEFAAADLRGMGSVNLGPVSGFRNRLVNGAFEVWQLGTSFSTPSSARVQADRWALSYDGSGSTFAVSREAASDAALLDRGIRWFWRSARTVAGSGGTYRQLFQRVEGVHNLAGSTVVVGLWAKADAPRTINILLTQNFGSAGSALVNVPVATIAVTNTWTYYQASASLPSIAGKTMGGGDDNLQLTFNLPLNAADTIDLADVQLQPGSTLSSMMAERVPYADALRACQRYRQLMPIGWSAIAYSSSACAIAGATVVPMRAAPSMSYSGSGSVLQPGIAETNSLTAPTVSAYDTLTGAIHLDWSGFSGLTASAPGFISNLASAAGILSAEL